MEINKKAYSFPTDFTNRDIQELWVKSKKDYKKFFDEIKKIKGYKPADSIPSRHDEVFFLNDSLCGIINDPDEVIFSGELTRGRDSSKYEGYNVFLEK
jgi:hypothetical protein